MKTIEMVKSWKGCVTFSCRKCGHQLIINVGTYTQQVVEAVDE